MSEWIPCSERLPNKRGEYLVTIKDSITYVRILEFAECLSDIDPYDFKDQHRPGWCRWDDEYGYVEYHNVTAWMLLPKPYSEESVDGERSNM